MSPFANWWERKKEEYHRLRAAKKPTAVLSPEETKRIAEYLQTPEGRAQKIQVRQMAGRCSGRTIAMSVKIERPAPKDS